MKLKLRQDSGADKCTNSVEHGTDDDELVVVEIKFG